MALTVSGDKHTHTHTRPKTVPRFPAAGKILFGAGPVPAQFVFAQSNATQSRATDALIARLGSGNQTPFVVSGLLMFIYQE